MEEPFQLASPASDSRECKNLLNCSLSWANLDGRLLHWPAVNQENSSEATRSFATDDASSRGSAYGTCLCRVNDQEFTAIWAQSQSKDNRQVRPKVC